jgi:hypothetical protein
MAQNGCFPNDDDEMMTNSLEELNVTIFGKTFL